MNSHRLTHAHRQTDRQTDRRSNTSNTQSLYIEQPHVHRETPTDRQTDRQRSTWRNWNRSRRPQLSMLERSLYERWRNVMF